MLNQKEYTLYRGTRVNLEHRLEEYQTKDATGKFTPYCGIVIWYLKKQIARASA